MTPRAPALAIAVLACGLASGCGASARTTAARTTAPASSTASIPLTVPTASTRAPPPPKPKAKAKARPKPTPSPGSLPQTDQLPSADTAGFHAEMAALWRGVLSSSVAAALPAFFPEGAYTQLKQIGDASGDYTDRLLVDYRLDLAAAHALLVADPGSARLVDVEVPASYAHWVSPGACYNGVGYYEVPNSRVVYREGGQLRSFGIASMISWRGVWYVVHLGAILRSGGAGEVDDPSSGTGESAPSSTC
jgi:hypothetical protein